MGVEPFLVTASTNLILAQRLARKVCSECRVPVEPTKQVVQALIDMGCKPEDARNAKLYKGEGAAPAPTPATRGVSPCTRSCPSRAAQRAGAPGRLDGGAQGRAIRIGMKSLRQSGLSRSSRV